jgi:hypothetical protein
MSKIYITRDEAIGLVSQNKDVYADGVNSSLKFMSVNMFSAMLADREKKFYIRALKTSAEGSFFIKNTNGKISNIRVRGVFDVNGVCSFEVIDWDGADLAPSKNLLQAIKQTDPNVAFNTPTVSQDLVQVAKAREYFKRHNMNYRTLSLDTRDGKNKWRTELDAYGAIIYANHGFVIASKFEVQGYTMRRKFVDTINTNKHVTDVYTLAEILRHNGFQTITDFN